MVRGSGHTHWDLSPTHPLAMPQPLFFTPFPSSSQHCALHLAVSIPPGLGGASWGEGPAGGLLTADSRRLGPRGHSLGPQLLHLPEGQGALLGPGELLFR